VKKHVLRSRQTMDCCRWFCAQGACRTVNLRSVDASRNGDWAQLTVPLINMNWWSSWFKSGDLPDFSGCSNSIGAWDVDTIQFQNKWGDKQALCLANVKAY
jgi:hypothetical protein